MKLFVLNFSLFQESLLFIGSKGLIFDVRMILLFSNMILFSFMFFYTLLNNNFVFIDDLLKFPKRHCLISIEIPKWFHSLLRIGLIFLSFLGIFSQKLYNILLSFILAFVIFLFMVHNIQQFVIHFGSTHIIILQQSRINSHRIVKISFFDCFIHPRSLYLGYN